MTTVRDQLEDALAILRERGMAKYVLEAEDGRVCANGALNLAVTGQSMWGSFVFRGSKLLTNEALMALAHVIEEQYPEMIVNFRYGDYRERDGVTMVASYVAHFNNHSQVSQEDLERVFEKAIANCDG